MTLLAGGMDDVFIESTLHLEDVAPHENFFLGKSATCFTSIKTPPFPHFPSPIQYISSPKKKEVNEPKSNDSKFRSNVP